MNNKKESIRLCLACREKKIKKHLIRIVKKKTGEIAVDGSKKEEGRGGYICCAESCFNILKKKRCLEKSFRCKIDEAVYLNLKNRVNGLK